MDNSSHEKSPSAPDHSFPSHTSPSPSPPPTVHLSASKSPEPAKERRPSDAFIETFAVSLESMESSTSEPPGSLPPNYVIPLESLTEEPDYIDCPSCQSRQRTVTEHVESGLTSCLTLLCCLIFTPGICLPLMCHWATNTEHRCGKKKCEKIVAVRSYKNETNVRRPEPKKEPVESKYPEFVTSAYTAVSEVERMRMERQECKAELAAPVGAESEEWRNKESACPSIGLPASEVVEMTAERRVVELPA